MRLVFILDSVKKKSSFFLQRDDKSLNLAVALAILIKHPSECERLFSWHSEL